MTESQHPTNEELLDTRFDLAEPDAMARVQSHLSKCEACRQRLERLSAKISSLDLLKDEIEPSADLLASVRGMATDDSPQARTPDVAVPVMTPTPKRRPSSLSFDRRRKFWIATVAAVALIGIAVLFWPEPDSGPEPVVEYMSQEEELPFEPASNIELNVLPTRDSVQMTIYNSADLTLIRERRKLTMKKGWNWLQYMWANTLIDPTSLELRPIGVGDDVEVIQLVFPPRMKGVGRWLLKSKISGPVECEITYFTSGINWRAFYIGTLTKDETAMQLQAYVRVDNRSGEDYEDAQTRLLVGKVNLLDKIAALARRKNAHGRPIAPFGDLPTSSTGGKWMNSLFVDGHVNGSMPDGGENGQDKTKQIKKEGLSEYFLYSIEGTETIPNGWGKRLPSFAKPAVPVSNLYKYDEDRWGRNVIRFLYFKNDKEHTLGETPIPNGTMRVFAEARTLPEVAVPEGPYLSYVGESSFKYIPVDEKVELNLGASRTVKVEPKLMQTVTENFTKDRLGNLNGWDVVQTWQVDINNARDIAARIEITRNTRSDYWQLDHNGQGINYKKHDAQHARFTLDLAPQTKKTLSYTLRVYHGKRREQVKK